MSNRNFLQDEWDAMLGEKQEKNTKQFSCSEVVNSNLNTLVNSLFQGEDALRSKCKTLAEKHNVDLQELFKKALEVCEDYIEDAE